MTEPAAAARPLRNRRHLDQDLVAVLIADDVAITCADPRHGGIVEIVECKLPWKGRDDADPSRSGDVPDLGLHDRGDMSGIGRCGEAAVGRNLSRPPECELGSRFTEELAAIVVQTDSKVDRLPWIDKRIGRRQLDVCHAIVVSARSLFGGRWRRGDRVRLLAVDEAVDPAARRDVDSPVRADRSGVARLAARKPSPTDDRNALRLVRLQNVPSAVLSEAIDLAIGIERAAAHDRAERLSPHDRLAGPLVEHMELGSIVETVDSIADNQRRGLAEHQFEDAPLGAALGDVTLFRSVERHDAAHRNADVVLFTVPCDDRVSVDGRRGVDSPT